MSELQVKTMFYLSQHIKLLLLNVVSVNEFRTRQVSFLAEGMDRIERRGFARGVESEKKRLSRS
jgi:hypothetical protein